MKIEYSEIKPTVDDVLYSQGIPESANVKEQVMDECGKALHILEKNAQPEGLIKQISKEEFATVFEGMGNNDPETPLQKIYPKANNLALYSITIGEKVSQIIADSFECNDFLLGTLLDSAASIAAEISVEVFEKIFSDQIQSASSNFVLSYSPGYCGWHISAQGKLFEYLNPGEIGISLNETFLMIPLKSVTGVLVDAAKEVHKFKIDFPFCSSCKHHSCLERMKRFHNKV